MRQNRGLLNSTRALKNDGNGDDITGVNQPKGSTSTRPVWQFCTVIALQGLRILSGLRLLQSEGRAWRWTMNHGRGTTTSASWGLGRRWNTHLRSFGTREGQSRNNQDPHQFGLKQSDQRLSECFTGSGQRTGLPEFRDNGNNGLNGLW
jgi:hypothetical protein